MASATVIGRIGALAVALGIGSAVVVSCPVAQADDAPSASTGSTGDDDGAPKGNAPSSPAGSDDSTGERESPADHSTADPRDGAVRTSVNRDRDTEGDRETEGVRETEDVREPEEVNDTGDAPPAPDSVAQESAVPTTVAPMETPTADPRRAPSADDGVVSARAAVAPVEPTAEDAVTRTATAARVASAPDIADVTLGVALAKPSPASVSTPPTLATTSPPPPFVAPPRVVPDSIAGFAAVLLSPFLTGSPTAPPAVGPVLWAVLAFVRNEFQRTFFNRAPTASPVQTGQSAAGLISGDLGAVDPDGDPLVYTVVRPPAQGSVTVADDGSYLYSPDLALAVSGGTDTFLVEVREANAASHIHGPAGLVATLVRALTLGAVNLDDGSAVHALVTVTVAANQAPTFANNAPQYVDPVTGVVSGGVVAADDGDALTYTVGRAPTKGVVVLGANGRYTYSPTLAGRITAGVTPGADLDTFTVTVGDGLSQTPVEVTVPVDPLQATATTTSVAPGRPPLPAAFTTDGSVAVVVDTATESVSLVDTATNNAIATIAVGAAPRGVALSPMGFPAYVTNSGDDSVTVILSIFEKRTIAVGSAPVGVVVSPDGSTVFVTNSGGDSVSVIDASTNTLTGTIDVGDLPVGVAVSPDGSTVFVTNSGDDSVSVIDAATSTVTSTVMVGTAPSAAVVSADGSTVYVANSGSDSVSVIDAATNSVITTVPVGDGPLAMMLGPDGASVLVTNTDGSVTLIAPSPTSAAQRTVTVESGEVRGPLRFTDPDGDPLTYILTGPASHGQVVFHADGTFTYVPDVQARIDALSTPGVDVDSFVLTANDGTTTTDATVVVPIVTPPLSSAVVDGAYIDPPPSINYVIPGGGQVPISQPPPVGTGLQVVFDFLPAVGAPAPAPGTPTFSYVFFDALRISP